MYQSLEIFRTSQAMALHAGKRQSVIARNIANADTPGYRRRDIPDFADVVRPDPATRMRATRASHLNGALAGRMPYADLREIAESEPNGNSVSLETEMMQAVAVQQAHDRALAIYRSGLTLLRTALGRR